MNKLWLLCIIPLLCLTCISCSDPNNPPDGYLDAGPTYVIFVQFTETGQRLTGHLQVVTEANTVPPTTQTASTPFTGTLNGSSVTLVLDKGLGLEASITGKLSGGTLSLMAPTADGHLVNGILKASSMQDYNKAVDALQKKVNQEDQQYYNGQATATSAQNAADAASTAVSATQVAQQNEQNAVSQANSQLGNALSALKSDEAGLASFSETTTLSGYAKDWKQMQNDYGTEKNDAKKGCGSYSSNLYQVQSDAYQVDSDGYQIQSDDYQLTSDKNQYDSSLSPVQSDIQAVKDGWKQLQSAVASNTTGTPSPQYTENDINKALGDAQNIEGASQSTWQGAQSSASQYDQEASALQKKADALPSSMHC